MLYITKGLEDGIEGATHTVGKRRLERERHRRSEEEARRTDEEEDDDKAAGEDRLTAKKEGSEEEEAEILEEALGMEVEEEGEG